MSLINYATKELTLKIVYYGPGLSGKTTNLQYLHSKIPAAKRSKLISLATESDRTLFFDFLPMELGKIKDFTVKIQLYTVPGQVRYNATRKLVLRGADAVVFVADSQTEMMEANIESYENMIDNLKENSLAPEDIPVVLQYNKRDLKNAASIEILNRAINPRSIPYYLAEAINGAGVEETFQAMVRILLSDFDRKIKLGPVTEHPKAKKDAAIPEPEILHGSDQYAEWGMETHETPANKPAARSAKQSEAKNKPAEQPKTEEITANPETVLAGFEFQTDWSFQSELADKGGEESGLLEAEALDVVEAEEIAPVEVKQKQEPVKEEILTAHAAIPAEEIKPVQAGPHDPAQNHQAVTAIKEVAENMGRRIENLETKLSDISSAIVSLKKAVSDISAKLEGMDGKKQAVAVDTAGIVSKVEEAIETRFKEAALSATFKDMLRLLRESKLAQGDILTILEKLTAVQKETPKRKSSGWFGRREED